MPNEEAQLVLRTIAERFPLSCVMSTELSLDNTINIPLNRYQDHLGRQTPALIFDARNGFMLNALYAGAGMVSHNGIVVILMPAGKGLKLENKNLKFSYGYTPQISYFSKIFESITMASNAARITSSKFSFPSSRIITTTPSDSLLAAKSDEIVLSAEQARITCEITKKVRSRISGAQGKCRSRVKNAVTVILGPRGRGKSTLLGNIANSIAKQISPCSGYIDIAVTSLHKNQLVAFYNTLDSLGTKHSSQNVNITYYAPDEIINRSNNHSIVLIDEVASIAPELIKNICTHFDYSILTGTTNGYEGSGKGFIQRLLHFL
jgi:tRNA(Met) cytidine acetyltransferase